MPAPWPNPRIVYCPRYNITVPGLQRLHPFDARKFGRAVRLLRQRFAGAFDHVLVGVPRSISPEGLRVLHSAAYLQSLGDAAVLARALEVPLLAKVPALVTDMIVLNPMRWATMGTIVAARQALTCGLAINLGGGYHHARPDYGHGFCIFADAGLAVHALRRQGLLQRQDRIVHIDLDAHQGDGVCRTFQDDARIFLYDQYNQDIFPGDRVAQRRIDCEVALEAGCDDATYLGVLRDRLPGFLRSVTTSRPVALAFYNAGTDILAGDGLGAMSVSAAGVRERDRYVLELLVQHRIPTVVLLGGGYTQQSHQLVADMAAFVLETWGPTSLQQ
jgi:histone deacetylase 11